MIPSAQSRTPTNGRDENDKRRMEVPEPRDRYTQTKIEILQYLRNEVDDIVEEITAYVKMWKDLVGKVSNEGNLGYHRIMNLYGEE
jgi:hypothetical protein